MPSRLLYLMSLTPLFYGMSCSRKADSTSDANAAAKQFARVKTESIPPGQICAEGGIKLISWLSRTVSSNDYNPLLDVGYSEQVICLKVEDIVLENTQKILAYNKQGLFM